MSVPVVSLNFLVRISIGSSPCVASFVRPKGSHARGSQPTRCSLDRKTTQPPIGSIDLSSLGLVCSQQQWRSFNSGHLSARPSCPIHLPRP